MMKDNPPKMKVNWVRVYQDPDDSVQKVGCSTPERPTRKWIEAHENVYKTQDDVRIPLCLRMFPHVSVTFYFADAISAPRYIL